MSNEEKVVVGNPATTTMPVPDYNQNNERKADYIKNRPFYEDWSLIAEARGNNLSKIIADRDLIEGEKLLLELEGTNGNRKYSISYLTVDNTGEGHSISDEGNRYDWYGAKTIEFIGDLGQTTAKLYSYTVVKHLEEKFIPESIARIGNVEAVQSDYNQNDETAKDYIKNRPCYEIEGVLGSVDGINETQIPSPVSVGSELKVTFAVNGGLIFDGRIKLQDGVTEYRCCVDCVKVIFDGMWLNVYNVSNEHDLSYTGTITVSQITVKTLGEKFIPDTIARKVDVEETKYTYVTDNKIGEAVPMDGDTTTFIGLDEELKTGDMIMVKGYFNDGTSESYVVEVGEIGGGYGGRIDADVGRLGRVHVPISTSVTFQSEVKGEVYRVSKVLIADAVTEIDTALNNIIAKYGLGGDA